MKQIINTDNKYSRVLYLDIAKGFAILFMFTQHCMLVHEKTAGEGSNFLANIFVLLGTAPSAPVFMMIMGVFIVFSKTSLQNNIFRGIKIILLGYLLNLLRFTIPLFIAGNSGFQYIGGETPISMFLAIDILQLAGLSIIIGSLGKRLFSNKIIAPILFLIILLISPLLWSKFGDVTWQSILWGNGKNVYFPFFPWFVYPLLGIYLGNYLLDIQNIRKNLKRLALFGILFIFMGIVFFNYFPIGDYHRSGAAIHSLIVGFVFLWLFVCFWISTKFEKNKITDILIFWSKNVTAVYFIQWVLFGWSILFFGANNQNAYVSAIIGIIVLILTHFVVKNQMIRKAFSWF